MTLDSRFGDIATAYARDVADKKIISCKWHRLACERHLKDLERAAAGTFPYVWNPELVSLAGKPYRPGERICQFAELMPHIKGDWAARGKLIKLEDWQVFILASIFGWVHKDTGKRRFRVADVIVPRKNAKSTIAAVIGLYMLGPDEEFGAEIYSGATSQDQALEVFRPALLMARATLRYCEKYKVRTAASNLSIQENNSKFEPVIGKPGDGASPSCAIVDEYHEHKTAELYDTMQTGMGARSQPLMLVITTAGSDISGPCFQHQGELQKILEGVVENDTRFGIIFTIDADDDWTTEEALRKANPNYGISVDPEFLKLQQRDAQENPRKQNIFKTKHLNVWVAAASPWLNLHRLQQLADPELTLQSMPWDGSAIGLDLASKQDIASSVVLCWIGDGDERHYYAISRNYVPEDALKKPENEHYQGWVHGGHLTATPGNMIALEQIQEDVLDDSAQIGTKEVAKDPWGGHQLGANLAEEGLEVVDVPQQVRHLSEPMKEIQALVESGRFHHDGNPCYVWQLSNVEVKEDRNENLFPRKARPANKIDAAIATIVAMNRALAGAKAASVYESRGVRYL
ncbi:phage terminase-like protein, large subunit [Acidovorax sp. CF316]|uniref:terminase large subunit n=1 Tax=Acidovorax sp. CF316 TaxID=1144317 RepID=UPI00026BC7F4|nr:terminase TerL endonuclease subunit [Acidovorax sp. CF316]EJE49585.1 phage terminase-like protein, large subunit [Acidovorax sp. CF316]